MSEIQQSYVFKIFLNRIFTKIGVAFLYLLGAVVFSLITPNLYSQEKGFIKNISEGLKKRAQKKDSLINANQPFLSIFAGPGYTPEAGLLIGGGLLYTFSTEPDNKALQRSSIPLLASFSTRGNLTLGSTINTFWADDLIRAKLIIQFSNVEDDYFGIGYDVNQSLDQGSNTTGYNREVLSLSPRIDARIWTNLYLGLSYRYESFQVKEVNPVMANDPNFLEYGSDIRSAGIAYHITYDSRDVVVNAYSGFLIDLLGYNVRPQLGGNQNYNVYEFDFRFYQQLNRSGNTLAFKLFGRQSTGDVPFNAMTRIGSTHLLRGYLNGQYRDLAGTVLTGEWRYMFLDNNRDMSQFGIVSWIGTGSIGTDFGDFNNWLPNVGLGFRYEVQPRMNVRIDVGFGKESAGLYFNFSEAF